MFVEMSSDTSAAKLCIDNSAAQVADTFIIAAFYLWFISDL